MTYMATAFLHDGHGEIVATIEVDPKEVWARVDPHDSVPGYEAQPWPGDIPAIINRPGFPRHGDVVLLGEWPNDERTGYSCPLQAYAYEGGTTWRYLSHWQTLAFLRRLRRGKRNRSPRYRHTWRAKTE